MSRLKALFEELGFADVATFISSGNVLFAAKSKNTSDLESQIAKHLETSLGYEVDTFVREGKDVAEIAASKTFPQDGQEGFTVHVGFLHQKLPRGVAQSLEAVRTETDEFRVNGREYYWLCQGRTSDSKVWSLPEVRALKLPTSTMRNMTSIRKLVAKHLG